MKANPNSLQKGWCVLLKVVPLNASKLQPPLYKFSLFKTSQFLYFLQIQAPNYSSITSIQEMKRMHQINLNLNPWGKNGLLEFASNHLSSVWIPFLNWLDLMD